MATELAKQAWFVRVQSTAEGSAPPVVIDFAVAKNTSQDAISAVLDHPAVGYDDEVTSTNQLTAIEIQSCHLKPDEVRTYGRRIYNAAAGRWVFATTSRRSATTRP